MLKAGYILSNRYQVIKPLGQGGQSNVYLLKDLRLKEKQWVAKEMTAQYADPKDQALAQKHFEQEANLLATLEHPNLPKVIDYFSQGGKHYLVMSYLKGEDLGRLLERRKGPFAEEDVAAWAYQIATVLYYLHRQKKPVIFRDIKPSNIMLSQDQVRLIDFGIARHFNPSKKGDTLRIGSPGYSPPEQYSGQTDQRSDIYSLGVTMHQLLTGQDPSKTQTPFKFAPIRALNPAISQKMVSIVEKAIMLEPEKRYQTALDMKSDLKSAMKGTKAEKSQDTVPVSAGVKTVPAGPPPSPGIKTAPGKTVAVKDDKEDFKTKEVPIPPAVKPTEPTPPAVSQSMPPKPETPGKKPLTPASIFIVITAVFTAFLLFSNPGTLTRYVSGFKDWIDFKTPSPLPSKAPVEDKSPEGRGILAMSQGNYLSAVDYLTDARNEKPGSPEIAILLNNALCLAQGGETVRVSIITGPEGNPGANSFLLGAAAAQARINGEGGIRGRYLVIQVFRAQREESPEKELLERAFGGDPLSVIMTGGEKSEEEAMALSEKKQMPLLLFNNGKGDVGPGVVRWKSAESDSLKALFALAHSAGIKKAVLVRNIKDSPISEDFRKGLSLKEKTLIGAEIAFDGAKPDPEEIERQIKTTGAGGVMIEGRGGSGEALVTLIGGLAVDRPVLLSENLLTAHSLKILEKRPDVLGASPLYRGPENFNSSGFMIFFSSYFNDAEPDFRAAGGSDLINLTAFMGRRTFPQNTRIFKYLTDREETAVFTGIIGTLPQKPGKRVWSRRKAHEGRWKQTGGIVFQ